MENNEDNRQMTPIAAELKLQNDILRGLRREHPGATVAINRTVGIIDTLESLLPKEQETIEKAFSDGFIYDPELSSMEYFEQTFKPHE